VPLLKCFICSVLFNQLNITKLKEYAMKKLLFTLVSLFILFAIGCQQDIIDPNATDSLNKPGNITAGHITTGKILLEGIVMDPSVPGGEYYILSGAVYYEHNLLSGPEPRATVELTLSIRATLRNLGGATYIISSESVDTLYVNEFGYMLEKLFFIPELNRTFCFDFLVTSSNVILSGRCFEFEKNGSTN
jgi:hypothetical protein